ncbi:phosphoglycerate kinase-like isoform X2 [Zingiber officinale]|uniref:phosphoglycerate kinase-like isoform X2 n=1 Tax=Zingiber officinale TaxID=94328 RepID=UPI001C4B5379|nr:phosphoglycerate kinase-like isoform X2 [Zingiber officinale]
MACGVLFLYVPLSIPPSSSSSSSSSSSFTEGSITMLSQATSRYLGWSRIPMPKSREVRTMGTKLVWHHGCRCWITAATEKPTTIASGAEFNDNDCTDCSDSVFHVQTLREFPIKKLYGEVVLVRFDSGLLLNSKDLDCVPLNRALSTIKYLHNAGAKVVLLSSWFQSNASVLLSEEAFADHLSWLLKVKVVTANGASAITQLKMKESGKSDILLLDNMTNFKEEVANSVDFAKSLSSGISLFVNDSFSLSHRILASTVGVTRFCYASIAGFHFEAELVQLMKISETKRRPYIAIIGGSNFQRKAKAMHHLASICDGLIFIGKLAFQMMHCFGLRIPAHLVEYDAVEETLELIKLTKVRNIPIYFQKDFLCVNVGKPKLQEIFTYDEISAGWAPIDLGPASFKETSDILSVCKKVLLIGSISSGFLKEDTAGTAQLSLLLERLRTNGCDVILVGNAARKAFVDKPSFSNQHSIIRNASVVWEFLRGTKLPGVAALDKAYPYDINWDATFADPTKPLLVDIGSGNGLFIFKMATKYTDFNFLGLEINKKLVRRCLDNLLPSEINNRYFLSTNATSTFSSIVSSYPGDLVIVTIQCPDPDFNRVNHRWSMVQRSLVEMIVDLLITNGKFQVFLESDIEAVAMRMKDLFIMHGKGKLLVHGHGKGWMEENPFGIQTDWEQRVVERGDPMYRIMLRKVP